MNNFGVIELASTKTTHAPGWAYVPDHPGSANPSKSVSAVHLHVNRNKRAARHANSAGGATTSQQQDEISARHDSKLQKEIEQLQRDSLGGRDVHVPIPNSSGGGRDKDGKIRGHTPNVRKILASQKTFANHLDDFEAWSRSQPVGGEGAGSGAGSAAGTPVPTSAPSGGSGGGNKKGGAAQKKGGPSSGGAKGRSSGSGKKSASITPAPAPPPPSADQDVTMTDAGPLDGATRPDAAAPTLIGAPESKILAPFVRFTPPPHPGDTDPLLESWLPPLPTDDELRELIRAPPLNYNQVRGKWTEDDTRYPTRHFCQVCGYWGRVKCMKCGTRVCALDCLDVHREECVTRYGL